MALALYQGVIGCYSIHTYNLSIIAQHIMLGHIQAINVCMCLRITTLSYSWVFMLEEALVWHKKA